MNIEDFVLYDIIVKSVESDYTWRRLKAQVSRTQPVRDHHCSVITKNTSTKVFIGL